MNNEPPIIPQQEVEANHFAMCLLMPEVFLRHDIQEMHTNNFSGGMEEWADYLAKKYQVSSVLMVARLAQLNLLKL